ncbi:MAG: flippase-like domain-containing protein [Acidobacteria bacterium]|nr:MAG: flippase-like domain-containing protein [Acidobacteriota bacterium]
MSERMGLSVAWSYGFAVLLLAFIFLILVPDADGPSPWDAQAFRSGTLELFANFRILDDLADLSIVKVADIGDGWLDVDLKLIAVSDRRFGWAPFYLALIFVSVALLLRGIRQRLVATHLGVDPSARGQISSYFFGRGLNLFFPFGPGETGTVQFLVNDGVPEETAANVVFHNRLLEVYGIVLLLVGGLAYLGWEGAIVPAFWTVVLLVAVVSLTRPLGQATTAASRWNVFAYVWAAFNGPALAKATRRLMQSPGFMVSVVLISLVALGIEILGYWCIKQAFSSPMDDYVLMKDLGFIQFVIVITVANMARVLPYTFASVGVYELVSVVMFRVFDEGYLTGATVSLLDSILINGLSLVAFVIVLWLGRCPSVFETWRVFFSQSSAQTEAAAS